MNFIMNFKRAAVNLSSLALLLTAICLAGINKAHALVTEILPDRSQFSSEASPDEKPTTITSYLTSAISYVTEDDPLFNPGFADDMRVNDLVNASEVGFVGYAIINRCGTRANDGELFRRSLAGLESVANIAKFSPGMNDGLHLLVAATETIFGLRSVYEGRQALKQGDQTAIDAACDFGIAYILLKAAALHIADLNKVERFLEAAGIDLRDPGNFFMMRDRLEAEVNRAKNN